MGLKWFFLINPEAGGKRAGKSWPKLSVLLAEKSIDFESAFSLSASHAIELVGSAVDNGFRNFIAVGGDGTMNLLVNGIFRHATVDQQEITIGIIPVGTGNDWIRSTGIPVSAIGAIELICRAKTGFHDIGKITFTGAQNQKVCYFINMAGFGFQGLIASRIEGVSSSIKKGAFAFVLGIFDALFRYKTTQVYISSSVWDVKDMIYNISIGIGRYCGGGMKMTPEAQTDDGLFDITLIKKISKSEVLLNLPGLFNGSFVKNKKVIRQRASKIWIESTPLLPAECDGEVLGYGNGEIEIIKGAIRVIIP